MARRVTMSQFRSKMRQAEAKSRQAARKLDSELKRQVQKIKNAESQFDREIRAYNARVQRDRTRIRSALSRLQRTPVTHTFTVTRNSAVALHESYLRVERSNRYDKSDPRYLLGVELPQQESANSLAVANALLTGALDDDLLDTDVQGTSITTELIDISPDLHDRWEGALFALHPRNRDAARHFCSSAREIFTQILHLRAPDSAVLSAIPHCDTDSQSRPTRRSRIRYLFHRKNMEGADLETFVENDIDDVIELFQVFNKGTHGSAGTFDLQQLLIIKRRVEDAIGYVSRLAS